MTDTELESVQKRIDSLNKSTGWTPPPADAQICHCCGKHFDTKSERMSHQSECFED